MSDSKDNRNRFRLQELREAISEEYQTVASEPDRDFHFHTGRKQAKIVEYPDELLEVVPPAALESFAGTGNPFNLGPIRPGERVIDIGCGAGIDSLIAAAKVGPDGQVIGVDMTDKMLKKARRAKAEAGLEQVEFRHGYGEELPVPDGWADVIISNGVLNLMPDKSAALQEMNRALKPEGRLQIADIIVEKEVPASAKRQIDLWTGWIAGALQDAELQATVVAAGFVDFEITWRKDIFSGAPQESSAADFGTHGINFRARKPDSVEEWQAAMADLTCEVPQFGDFLDL